MYSQGQEEKIILDYFGEQSGKFLDIGAYDGVTFSNTYALVEKGWTGVMIDPSITMFPKLLANMEGKPVECSNIVITGNKSELISFYDSNGEFLSTNVPEMFDKWKGTNWSKFTTKSVSINELLDYFGYDFKFISIDVEGANWELFKHLPFTLLDELQLLCIEYDKHLDLIKMFAYEFGFEPIFQNAENVILKRNG